MVATPSRLVLVALVALAGCSAAPEAPPSMSARSGLDTTKRLQVDRVREQQEVRFVPGSTEPAPGERDRFLAFIDAAGVRAKDRVYLEPAAGDRLAAARLARLAALLHGQDLQPEVLPAALHGTPANEMLVLVDRYVAKLPACPDWTAPPANEHDNRPASNFGCADVTNLGLMLVDPRDLVAGREMGPPESDPALAAIARYRSDKVKPVGSSTSIAPSASAATAGPSAGGGTSSQ